MNSVNYMQVMPGGHCLTCHKDFDEEGKDHACFKDPKPTACTHKCRNSKYLGNSQLPMAEQKNDTDIVSDIIELDNVLESTNRYGEDSIKQTLKEQNLAPVETVRITNPITGKVTDVTIERDGTSESKLILALADKTNTREKKDAILSLYLFERGKESSSFIMDIMRYKGEHTKESRAFKSQMRFDFEMFVDSFTRHLRKRATAVYKRLASDVNIAEFHSKYVAYLNEMKTKKVEQDDPFTSFLMIQGFTERDLAELMQLETAMLDYDEADTLASQTRKITETRMREKGFGIYINKQGRPYSIFEDNTDDVMNALQKDLEALDKQNE